MKALETMLIDAGILSRDALESFEPDDAQEAAWSQARFQLIKDVVESGANITEK